MPGFLLHVGSVVQCKHGGLCTPTAPDPRVRVSGMNITLQPIPWVVAGCAMPPPPAGNGPDATVTWVTAAIRVRSMGMPVLLFDSIGIALITGLPVTVVMTQVRVKGM